VGGASSNGGNVLDWARRNLGEARVRHAGDAPLFFPFVFGERTPFWDPGLRPRWVGVGSGHTARDLAAAVPEAIAFSVARQTQLLSETGPRPEAGFLSGNAFETPELDRVLATLAPFPIIRPPAPGLATLRGAAIMGFRALGIDPPTRPADSVPVPPLGEGRAEAIRERFGRFLEHYVR
jgi:gluconokinase